MCEEHNHSGHKHCEHCHEKENLNKVYLASLIFIFALFIENSYLKIGLFITAYIISGYEIIFNAIKNIIKGKIFDENFLMSIATIGAILIKEYPEAVCVMILYQIGEFLQHKAVDNTKKSIYELMNIKAEYANKEENGVLIKKKPEEISVDDIITVKSGEKIPLDGIIIEGQSFLDTSSITGESTLRNVKEGDYVFSGAINTNGVLKIKVQKEYKESTVAKILELVELASEKKSQTENFIKRFAKIYTPIVVICAVLLVTIPVFIYGLSSFNIWFERALTFLVISCPCALVISVPLTFFCGIGYASKNGILIKGSNYLELISKPEYVVFDKTGTLTKGTLKVKSIIPEKNYTEQELLKYAAYIENFSNHPIAKAIKEAFSGISDVTKIKNTKEIIGKGMQAAIKGEIITIGNKELIESLGIKLSEYNDLGTVIYLAKNKDYMGRIIISDEIKDNAQETIKELHKYNIKTIILSGDREINVKSVQENLGIDKYYAELLPVNKVEKIDYILANKNKEKSIIYTGDGINDAPVLMRSDIGIAMGALGSDAAIEAADIIITDDNLKKISTVIKISKKTMQIVKQNIAFSIGIKFLFLLLGSIGLMTMWGAVFADVGVTLAAVLNSIRAFRCK